MPTVLLYLKLFW